MSATLQASSGWQRFRSYLTSDPRILITGVVLLLAHGPLLYLHIHSLSEWSDYQFFPYAILASLFLAFRAFQTTDLEHPHRVSSWYCYTLLFLSWLVLAFGLFVVSSPRAGALALISTVVAVTLAFGETALLKRLLPAIVIFCMIIPLPWNLDQTVVRALQSLSSKESGKALDLLGIPNMVQAHSVKLPSTTLQVEEGCSGINSLFTILITAVLYVCWMKRPLFRSLLLLAAAVSAMIVANVFRVVAVGVLAEDFGYDWSSGWRHEVLGLFFFGIALLLVGSVDQLLIWAAHVMRWFRWQWVTAPVKRLFPRRKKAARALVESELQPPGLAPCFSIPVALGFGLLALAQAAWFVPTKFDLRSDSEVVDRTEKLPFEKLAAVCSDWKTTEIEKLPPRDRTSPFGRYSIQAGYELKGALAKLELDYPFFGFHNLTNCYNLRGWDVRSTNILETQLVDQHPGDTVEQVLTKGVDGHAYLLYSIHDSGGRILKRPVRGPNQRWLQAHLLSPRGLNIHLCALFHIEIGEQQVFSAEPEWYMPTLQMQIFVQGLKPIDAKQKQEARTYFDSARNVLFREMAHLPESQP